MGAIREWLSAWKTQRSPSPAAVVEVFGEMEGIICTSDTVVIAPTGQCRGNIQAACLEIAGKVYGSVEVHSLMIQHTGLLRGKARYRSLTMAEGGSILQDEEAERLKSVERNAAVNAEEVAKNDKAAEVSLSQAPRKQLVLIKSERSERSVALEQSAGRKAIMNANPSSANSEGPWFVGSY